MTVILDVSVVLGWCLPNEQTSFTEAAHNHAALHGAAVPPLWWYELRNALIVNERRGRITPTHADIFLADLQKFFIHTDDLPGYAVTTLARTHGLTVYDAAYLDLALRTGYPLATLDRKLVLAAKAEGVTLFA